LSNRRITWGVPLLTAAAVAVVVVAGLTYATMSRTGGAPTAAPLAAPQTVTGSPCERESALVGAALRHTSTTADVDGDGAADRVAVAVDDDGPPGCRTFLGVRTATGTTYSTAMPDASPTPLPFPPDVIGLPRLGDGGAEIVVDTHAAADGALAQMYTLTGSGLVQVQVPGVGDGFYVEGGGVTAPHGADCRADGALLLSGAELRGQRYLVTRRYYTLTRDRLLVAEPPSTSEVAVDDLVRRFPEFVAPHFAACGGLVGPAR
jgi:hypothetical protein